MDTPLHALKWSLSEEAKTLKWTAHKRQDESRGAITEGCSIKYHKAASNYKTRLPRILYKQFKYLTITLRLLTGNTHINEVHDNLFTHFNTTTGETCSAAGLAWTLFNALKKYFHPRVLLVCIVLTHFNRLVTFQCQTKITRVKAKFSF